MLNSLITNEIAKKVEDALKGQKITDFNITDETVEFWTEDYFLIIEFDHDNPEDFQMILDIHNHKNKEVIC